MAGITQFSFFQKPSLAGVVDFTQTNFTNTFVDDYLPTENVFNSTFSYDILNSNPQIAGVIGYGAEAPIADRNKVQRVLGEVVKMGIKYVVTEEELLSLHNARFQSEHDAAVEQLATKSSDLVKAVLQRIYVQKAQAMVNGNFVHDANGVKLNINFGLDTVLTPGTVWSTTTADIIGDLINWVQTYQNNNNGETPDELIVSREVMVNMMKNKDIVALSGTALPLTRVGQDVVNSVLAGFGLPPVRVVSYKTLSFTDIYTGNAITETIFLANRILLVGKGLGAYKLGPTVENNFQPGISLEAYDKQEPIESVIKAVAAGFPAIVRPKRIMRADVQ